MFYLYCPHCGGRLILQPDSKSSRCESCGSVFDIPQGYTQIESELLAAREAHLRTDFDEAESAYGKIVQRYPDNAAAYWGRALARFQVEYQSGSEGSYHIVCHQSEQFHFDRDSDVQQAIALAEAEEQQQYTREAAAIFSMLRAVAEYKPRRAIDIILEADRKSKRAIDIAQTLSRAFSAMDYGVLCPALDLGGAAPESREPVLCHAFKTAVVYLLIACDANEVPQDLIFNCKRFLSKKSRAERAADERVPRLYLCVDEQYGDLYIPDFIRRGSDKQIVIDASDYVERAEALVGTALSAKRIDDVSKDSLEHQYTNLIDQSRRALKLGDFEEAKESFEHIKDINAEESQAYWGLLLCTYEARDEDALIRLGVDITQDTNYILALKYASERERQLYQGFAAKALEQKSYNDIPISQTEEPIQEEQKQEKKAHKPKKRHGCLRGFVTLLLLIVLAIGLVIGYVYFQNVIRPELEEERNYEDQYRRANELYLDEEFDLALSKFEYLADRNYKDSAQWVENAQAGVNRKRQEDIQRIIENADPMNREKDVRALLNLRKYSEEADRQLEIWKQEAIQAYKLGHYGNAWYTLKSYYGEEETLYDVVRHIAGMGIISMAENGDVLALHAHTGIPFTRYGSLAVEEVPSLAACISPSGMSAATVRLDGTVSLVGDVADCVDVSDWTDIWQIKIDDETVIGLNRSGQLKSTRDGVLAENIELFDAVGSAIVALRRDGTVFTANLADAEAVQSWTDMRYVCTDGKVVYGVNAANQALCGDKVIKENVRTVHAGYDRLCTISLSGKLVIDDDYGGYDVSRTLTAAISEAGILIACDDCDLSFNATYTRSQVMNEMSNIGPAMEREDER